MVPQQCHVNTYSKLCIITFGLTVQFEYGFEMQFRQLIYFIVYFFSDICGALRNLVPFAQSKKREKHTWWSVTFSKAAGFSLQLY